MTHSMKAIARVMALVALLSLVAIAPASAVSSSTYETQIFDATNAYRVELGKVPVKHQKCLDRFAKSQAKWMAKNNVLQHRNGRLLKIIKSCKVSSASENIAYKFSSGTKTVAAWRNSSSHSKNMRATKMRYVGVSAVQAKNGVWYVAQVFGSRK